MSIRCRPAGKECVQRAEPAGHEQIPARQVQLWECQVPSAEHQWNHEVADGDGHCGDQKEPHHDMPCMVNSRL